MSPEFNLIQKYFTRPSQQSDLGVGDDAALLRVEVGKQLVVSTDMSVVGTHFFNDCAPYLIGWKSLAVNVSDMAAMGANPKWATLALALPEINDDWLAEFSRGFFACADTFGVDLIGGDTTRGPLNIGIQVMGDVPTGQALRRDGAKINDEIWVSGNLGDAGLALAVMQNRVALSDFGLGDDDFTQCRQALEQPQPQVALGIALRGIANSAIDVSDGLLSDLGHILQRSNVGAELDFLSMPQSSIVSTYLQASIDKSVLLSGGDDYALCFTAPAAAHQKISELANVLNIKLSMIGHITEATDLKIFDEHQKPISLNHTGYDHFA